MLFRSAPRSNSSRAQGSSIGSTGAGSSSGSGAPSGGMGELHRNTRAQYGFTGTSHGVRGNVSSSEGGYEGERGNFTNSMPLNQTGSPNITGNSLAYRNRTHSPSRDAQDPAASRSAQLSGLQSGSSLAQVLAAANASINAVNNTGNNESSFGTNQGYQRRKSRIGSSGTIPVQKLGKSLGT